MQEQEVSVGRRSYVLEPPFFVIATQNPIEQEGTYPLPEAQLDRFMFNIPVTYPTPDEEVAIVKSTTVSSSPRNSRPVLDAGEIVRLQRLVRGVPVADAVVRYAVDLVIASRPGHGQGRASDPQVPDLRGQPAGLAVPDPGRQGAGRPGRAVPRRFRRRPGRRRARPAASAGAQFPRPGRGNRRRSTDPADHRDRPSGEIVSHPRRQQQAAGRDPGQRMSRIATGPFPEPARAQVRGMLDRMRPGRTSGRREPRLPEPRLGDVVDPRLLAKLEDLELIARTAVEGFLHGLHRSPYVGFSVEFASHREYLPGDDLRHLNWKLFGRNDKLYVKQYDAETNLDCHLVVDVSASMETASAGLSKRRYATMLAAALAHLALRQHDAVGAILFADRVLAHVKPRARSAQLNEILAALARRPGIGRRPQPPVLHEVAELMPRRGLVVLISDLFFAPDEVFSGLDHLPFHGHDLLVFHVLDPLEARPAGGRTGSLPRPRDGRRADHPGGGDPGGVYGGRRLLVRRARSGIGSDAGSIGWR